MGLRKSHDDPGIQAFFPSTRRVVRGGELVRYYVGVSLHLAALGWKEREGLGGSGCLKTIRGDLGFLSHPKGG